MKRILRKTELASLWKKEGDLLKIQTFFHTVTSGQEGNTQIKESIKQKALEKLANLKELEDLSVPAQESIMRRIWTRLRKMMVIQHWKLSLSIATLLLMVIIGQGAMNSWNIFPGMGSTSLVKQQLSIGGAPQVADSISSYGNQHSTSAQANSIAPSEGVAPKTALSSNPSAKGVKIAPHLPIALEAPPADASLPRKITHDLTLTLEVTTIDEVVTKINNEVQLLGGYVSESQQSGSENQFSAHLTLKIPADKLNGLSDTFSTLGKVLDQHTLANDISNQYYDSQSRLKTLEAEEQRYLEILNQAKTVDDVLKVENALGNIRQQIEQLQGQLILWNHLVDYSTVNLQLVTSQNPNISVKNPWQPISWSKTWKASQDAVLKTISSSWNVLNYLVIGLGYLLPYLLVGAGLWGAYRVWKKRKSE